MSEYNFRSFENNTYGMFSIIVLSRLCFFMDRIMSI